VGRTHAPGSMIVGHTCPLKLSSAVITILHPFLDSGATTCWVVRSNGTENRFKSWVRLGVRF
jgi:hypothetical protein